MEITKLFTQKEVNKIFIHIPSKTLRWWGMRDLYGWANQISDGRGIHREYELGHLYQIGIVEELSSLNIPVGAINKIMRKNFLSGMLMYPVQRDLEKDEWGGGKRVDVVDQMNKMLIITKTLSGSYKRLPRKRPPEYEGFLVDRTEPEIISGPGELLKNNVMIVINLAIIRNFVDHIVSVFTGEKRYVIPADI